MPGSEQRPIHLLTNGSYRQQLGDLPDSVVIVDLERRLDHVVSPGGIELIDGDSAPITLASGSAVCFLPFRSPLEPSDKPASLSAVYDFVSLIVGLRNVGIAVRNDPLNWVRAYDKSSIYGLGDIVDVPETVISNRIDRLPLSTSKMRYLLKSGLGIKKSFRGQYVQAALLPETGVLAAPTSLRYVAQEYVEPEREIRAYVVSGQPGDTLLFDMPIGSAATPDWRDDVAEGEWRATPFQDSKLATSCLSILAALGLDYVCLDFVVRRDNYYLIDVNPHGSWAWLPTIAASAVREMMVSFVVDSSKAVSA